jgi:hypothetical protein
MELLCFCSMTPRLGEGTAAAPPGGVRARALILLLLAGWGAPALAKQGYLDRLAAPFRSTERLARVIERVAAVAKAGGKPKVVFDLDDTLILNATGGATRGAVAFLDRIVAAGGEVVIVSGRPESLRSATSRKLNRLGFTKKRTLILDPGPQKGVHPVAFKVQMHPIIAASGTIVAVFDNEKENVRALRRLAPDAFVFRVRSRSHWADPGGSSRNGPIYVIPDFALQRASRAARFRR